MEVQQEVFVFRASAQPCNKSTFTSPKVKCLVGQGVVDRKVTGSIPTVADFRRKKNRLRNILRENSECLLDSRSSGQHSLE